MKNLVYLFVLFCFLAGCSSNSKPNFIVGVQGDSGPSVKVDVKTEPKQAIAIKPEAGKPMPVTIGFDWWMTGGVFVAVVIAFYIGRTVGSTKKSVEGLKTNFSQHRNTTGQ